ncbi:MAG: hypothetical protein J7M39_07280 [Anaerolineae bacterium]|nr:hypothetical protein [Anaerolineae bacterium]
MERLLDAHVMGQYFADWVAATDPYAGTSIPAVLPALADRYQSDPARCLVVGDRDLEVLTRRVPV